MQNNLRIIVLVEESAERETLQRELIRQQVVFTGWPVTSERQFQIAVKDFGPDLVIADWAFPSCEGPNALAIARQLQPRTPFVVLTATEEDQRAVAALGASWVMALPRTEWGGLGGAVGSLLREQQAAKKTEEAEAALRELETRFNLVWDKVRDGLRLTDHHGTILMVNESYCRLVERPRQALVGQSLACVYEAAEQARMLEEFSQKRLGPNAEPATAREVALWNGKRVTFVEEVFSLNEGGTPPQTLSLFREPGGQNLVESHVLLAQRMECVGTLAEGVAHDLNNILTPMILAIPVLREAPSAEWKSALEMIEHGAARAAEIVHQLLSFRKSETGARAPLQCRHLFTELAKTLEQRYPAHLRVVCSAATELWPVQGDPTQIQQALMNLCQNACEAMPSGGELKVTADNVVVEPAEAAIHPGARFGPHVRLQVRDPGLGIAPDKLPSIFDPFFTTKSGHTGLGLTVVLGIVKSHGGFMKVQSQAGAWTSMEIFLPALMEAAPQATKAPEKISPPCGEGETILVVEDEDDIRIMTERLLKRLGYRVMQAVNGVEALSLFEQHQGEIDLVVTDLIMPKMDGMTLVRKLREKSSGVKIIILTGAVKSMGVDSNMAFLAEMNVSFFLTKPFTLNQMLIALHTALHPA